jgi:AcrR family transcriptional regulator
MPTALAARPSTRDQLLAAGRELVLRDGVAALTVRAVAAAAGANPGSFVYHFGTRDAFLRELLEDWYAPLLQGVATVAANDAPAIERLRGAILSLIDFGREHHAFIGRLVLAAAAGEAVAREFITSLAGRHPQLLLRLVAAAQAEGDIVAEEPLQVLCLLMGSVGLPLLVASAWQGSSPFDKTFSAALGRIVRDPQRIRQRLDWALRGLRPEEG